MSAILDSSPDNNGLMIKFYKKSVPHPHESKMQGRPIFLDMDYITIEIAGRSDTIIDTAVTDYHRERFPMAWQRYKSRTDDKTELGTPLSQWQILTPAQAEELRALHFHTVENVAGAADSVLAGITMIAGMNGLSLRERAKEFLRVAGDSQLVAAQDSKIAEMEARSKARDEEHAKEMAELRAKLEAMGSPTSHVDAGQPGKRRGRPPKSETVAA